MSIHQPTWVDKSPRVVIVGGLDPGTGAGVARDMLTAATLSSHSVLVGTAWTEQGSSSARAIEPRAPERVRLALAVALEKVAAAGCCVKIGMVATAPIAQAILMALQSYPGPIVYDPVLCASSGDPLYDGDRETILALARKVTLLTPNLSEAAWLLDRPVHSESDARESARALQAKGVAAVLVKGGHLEGDATDVLLSPSGETLFSSPRIAGPSPRGTGCALATAIAVELARGEPLERAVAAAKTWLTGRIANAHPIGDERHL